MDTFHGLEARPDVGVAAFRVCRACFLCKHHVGSCETYELSANNSLLQSICLLVSRDLSLIVLRPEPRKRRCKFMQIANGTDAMSCLTWSRM